MAWEQRGPQTYYYGCVRRHGHVAKEYVGTGLLVALYEDHNRAYAFHMPLCHGRSCPRGVWGMGADCPHIPWHLRLVSFNSARDGTAHKNNLPPAPNWRGMCGAQH